MDDGSDSLDASTTAKRSVVCRLASGWLVAAACVQRIRRRRRATP